ncbi:MAG TPA: FG-GAP-like repeat-containing protein [Patescibacteria group bacterium]|nr:FG-GAP-like repeat-containing protein [Patescibacteria group bacterium]
MKKYSTLLAFLFLPSVSLAQDATWFSDATAKVGLTGAKAFRINVVDLNNDDYPDLMLINSQGSISTQQKLTKLYMNIQDPASANPKDRIFKDVTEGSGIFTSAVGDTGRVFSCATMADVNNDGNMDLVTGPWYHKLESFLFPFDRCDVMLGDGQGHFTLVPDNGLNELGLINVVGFTFLDFDLDGNLDIYIPTYFEDLTNNIFHQDYLMKGRGDGTFENVSQSAGISNVKYPMHGSSSTDWNNDGWPDVFTSAYCRSGGSLWKNNGNGTFTDMATIAKYSSLLGGDNNQATCQWAAQPADFDNDGDMDIAQVLVHGGLDGNEARTLISINQGMQNGYRLERDITRFTRDNVSRSSHLGDQDGSWFEIDNDGKLDFAIAQAVYLPNTDRAYILHQNTVGKFDDITPETELLWLKETHNIRPIDYDLDGDEDLLVELWRKAGKTVSDLALVENKIGDKSNRVNVKLIAPTGVNKNAVGARITLYSGGTAQIREVQLGQGHFGAQQSVVKTFGLGQNSTIDSIVVRWPAKNMPNTVVVNPPYNDLLKISASGLVLSVEEGFKNNSFEIFPNPAQNTISVHLPQNFREGTIAIFNQLGLKLTEIKTFTEDSVHISIKELPVGVFVMKCTDGAGRITTKNFIKQ